MARRATEEGAYTIEGGVDGEGAGGVEGTMTEKKYCARLQISISYDVIHARVCVLTHADL